MSDLNVLIAQIDATYETSIRTAQEAYNNAIKGAKINLARLSFEVFSHPEISTKVTLAEVENVSDAALKDIENFQNLLRATVESVRQRGN